MLSSSARRGAAVLLSAAVLTTLSACGAAPDQPAYKAADGKAKTQPGSATSVADFGGMEALVAAAEKEGTLNVIALPADWANYGEIQKAFQAKYPKVKISAENPDASSADEIAAVKSRKGQTRAPDVLDLGIAFARSGAA